MKIRVRKLIDKMKKASPSRLDQACLECLEAYLKPLVALENKFEEIELASQDKEAVASLSQEFENGKLAQGSFFGIDDEIAFAESRTALRK